jgi:hypothetical protein
VSYHIVRFLVLTIALTGVVLTTFVFAMTFTSEALRIERRATLSALLLLLPITALWAYWAWFVNWGRHRAHSAVVCVTLAIAVLAIPVLAAGAAYFRRIDATVSLLTLVPILTTALGVRLRLPRIISERLDRGRRKGDVEAVAAGLNSSWPFVRRHAARLLGEMRAIDALPALRSAARHAPPSLLNDVLAAIESIEAGDSSEAEPAERDPWSADRRWAAKR